MRARRSVAETPTGMPSRSLKAAIDFRARRTFGCCPAMIASCSWASSKERASCFSLPSPMFRVIFRSFGASIGVE